MRSDRVTLTVPARGEFARTVRMTAAELASRLGMSYDEVDDVRMAAEEAFVYACDRAPGGGEVVFCLELGDDTLTMTVGPFACESAESEEPPIGYAEFILQSVCDDFSIDRTATTCTLTLVKRASSIEVAGA
jgi:serine/threonine-protein kinase RsbW